MDKQTAEAEVTKPAKPRAHNFPILHFSKLLDQFLKDHPSDGDSVDALKESVNEALLATIKK